MKTDWNDGFAGMGWSYEALDDEAREADLFFEELMGRGSGVRRRRRPAFESRPEFESYPAIESAPMTLDFAGETKPSYLVSHNFLGNSVEVNPVMARRLTDAEQAIRRAFDALGPNHASRVHYGGGQKTLREWAGVLSGRGWRPGSSTSKHASGSAVDLNYSLQPYIVMRTTVNGRTTLGGEAAGAGLRAQRQHAGEVDDRAVRFTALTPNVMSLTAPMHVRSSGESTRDAYNRLAGVDRALNRYFRHAMLEDPTDVRRRPIADIEGATEAELLAAVPLTERRNEAQAIGDLEALMGTRFTPNLATDPQRLGTHSAADLFSHAPGLRAHADPLGDRKPRRSAAADSQPDPRILAHASGRRCRPGRRRALALGRD